MEAPYPSIPLWMTVRSMGGDLLDRDWKQYTLDQAAGVAVIQWIADLALRHRVALPPRRRRPARSPRAGWG